MIKINATEQTSSATEKSSNGIFRIPSVPNTIPKTIKANRAGIPILPEIRVKNKHNKITAVTKRIVVIKNVLLLVSFT